MQLINLTVGELVAGAGGDPWEINRTLQAGQPMQISNLANAFHSAGRSTAEADATFEQARKRFESAWNHQNGDSPINDSAEVQRTVQALGAQSQQLPKIGADLENIAAALAEAQKSGAAEIATLERQLQLLDKIIGAAKKDLEDGSLTFPATDPAARIAVHRVTMTAPTGSPTSSLPPQQGTAAAPVDDVFGGWHIVGHDMTADRVPGTNTDPAQWPAELADTASCVDKAPDPVQRRLFLLNGVHPRSEFPTQPPHPGWPAGSVS
jgi:hypothetical protein